MAVAVELLVAATGVVAVEFATGLLEVVVMPVAEKEVALGLGISKGGESQ